uniref:Methyltransferase-like protein n=1 Tax=Gouania willdenowi TaxID=441366 RepID=A0A8C5DUL9_GOUWI
MKILQRLSASKLTPVFIRLFLRLKSSRERPSAPLGSRLLTNPDDVFKHNTWLVRKKCLKSSLISPATDEFDKEASLHWNSFYEVHQDRFFKDRNWLCLEFPELFPLAVKDQTVSKSNSHHSLHQESPQTFAFPGQHASFRILEVGCGVGNSVFPILNKTNSFLYCCDFSPRAIKLVMHQDYDDSVCHAFVHDLCEAEASFPFPPQSLDVILAVFVLSSIHPKIEGVINRISAYLKPGGTFLFRDYGRYDLTQLRFKKGQCVSESFYMRGDGTCVYFFTKEEVHQLFTKAGLEETQNLEDRRLQVNRGRKVIMHRVWIQSKYRKPYLCQPITKWSM